MLAKLNPGAKCFAPNLFNVSERESGFLKHNEVIGLDFSLDCCVESLWLVDKFRCNVLETVRNLQKAESASLEALRMQYAAWRCPCGAFEPCNSDFLKRVESRVAMTLGLLFGH